MSKMEIYYNTSLPVGDDIESGRPCSIVYFDKKGNVTHQEDYNLENIEISKSALESLARALLPDIQEYFSSEEGKKALEELNEQKEEDCKRKKEKVILLIAVRENNKGNVGAKIEVFYTNFDTFTYAPILQDRF